MWRHSIESCQVDILDDHIVDGMSRQRLATLTHQEVLHLTCWPDLQIVLNGSAGLGIERHTSGLVSLASSHIELTGTLTQAEIIETQRCQFSSTHSCVIKQQDDTAIADALFPRGSFYTPLQAIPLLAIQ